ncbi:MAG: endonuclease III [bacterium]|nr:endonuclease III [bacterium]
MQNVLQSLDARYPHAQCSLDFSNPLELLVATILSAQCTDKRVNLVTKTLFNKYKTAHDYATAPLAELEQDVRSTGFYRNKAKAIQGAARMIVETFDGRVPSTMDELIQLPGVARKTANVVLGNAFGKAEGIVVDTHVSRISQRLGLTQKKDPIKIEQDLMQFIPKDRWTTFAHQMIQFGREICKAPKPKCPDCPIRSFCPSAKVFYPDL